MLSAAFLYLSVDPCRHTLERTNPFWGNKATTRLQRSYNKAQENCQTIQVKQNRGDIVQTVCGIEVQSSPLRKWNLYSKQPSADYSPADGCCPMLLVINESLTLRTSQ